MQIKKEQLEPDMEQWTGQPQIRRGVCQDCVMSPCLFNLYAEYIMQNVGLDEAQDGIKVSWRNDFERHLDCQKIKPVNTKGNQS